MCLTATFLATGGFKFELFQNTFMVYKHAYLNTLLLLHFAFMLSVVKMPLKGEVGGHAINCFGITLLIMENHRNIMELCFLISVGTLNLYVSVVFSGHT